MFRTIALSLGLYTLLIVSFSSCNKKDKTSTEVKDCEKNNYAIITVNFASDTNKHSVIVTPDGSSSFREKTFNKGTTSDTIHVAPGVYALNISSLNESNQALDSKNVPAAVSQCGNLPVSVSF